jgi:hypothetical protein|tara:strand:- start:5267 stop:5485 length:219 start_codon:yes stop_codon:yes gene_type:complete
MSKFNKYAEGKFGLHIPEMYGRPICNKCKHKNPNSITCKAYPKGIPDEIIFDKVDHRKPYIEDNGIVFEPKT